MKEGTVNGDARGGDRESTTFTAPFLDVALPVPLLSNFTYSVPQELRGRAALGARVLVPFGRRVLTGYAVGERGETELAQVKDILDVVDESPLLSPELFELALWMSEYYVAPLGSVIKTVLPAGLVRESRMNVSLCEDAGLGKETLEGLTKAQRAVLGLLIAKSPQSLSGLRRGLARQRVAASVWSVVSSLERKGLARTEQVLKGALSGARKTKIVVLTGNRPRPGREREELLGKSKRQRECYEWMENVRSPVELDHLTKRVGFSARMVHALVEKGLLAIEEKEEEAEVPKLSPDGFGDGWASFVPTEEQRRAKERILDSVARKAPETFLLFGVTGSGKTVIYIEVLREALERGLSAIVLVPEISLTPQTISRFREVFPGSVATVHSGLTPRERFEIWRAAREGKARILVGPRSAVFAPMKNLGVIIIDEEHESSYKQEDTPRYHAREVALRRAAIEGVTVVLGSATPSLDSYYKADEGKYNLIELPERVGTGVFPSIRIVDMKDEIGRTVISEELRRAIGQRIAGKEQVMLFLNRRGYSSFLQCSTCGWVTHCDQCNIALTLHRRPLSLVCHYCGHKEDIPEKCPKCGRTSLAMRGMGTERVDREIKEMFPGVKVERMDLDTTSGKWSHRDILVKFLGGETQILLGTQMIAKGLDFPNVTLVGVVSADTGMNLPDYRATERTFQILTQVAGRTGRGEKGGLVIIQTCMSDVSVIEAVRRQDYRKFAEEELATRREAEYPPYFALANVIAMGKNEEEVRGVAWELTDALGALAGPDNGETLRIIGPAPCAHTKLKGMFRWHVLVKSRDEVRLEGLLSSFAAMWYKGKGGVRVIVDRDPMSLM